MKAETRPKAHPLYKVTKEAWIKAAVQILAKKGISGVDISVLASKLKATKGSFYWHFKNKRELLMEVFIFFENNYTYSFIDQIDKINGSAIDKLLVLFRLTFSQKKNDTHLELAIRDWARHDSLISKKCIKMDQVRLRYCQKLFVEAGIDNAKTRSFGMYSFIIGCSLLPEFLKVDCESLSTEVLKLIIYGKFHR